MEGQGCRYRIQSKPLCDVCVCIPSFASVLLGLGIRERKNVCLGMAFPMEHNVLQHNIRCIFLCIGKHYIFIFCETPTLDYYLLSLSVGRPIVTDLGGIFWSLNAQLFLFMAPATIQ